MQNKNARSCRNFIYLHLNVGKPSFFHGLINFGFVRRACTDHTFIIQRIKYTSLFIWYSVSLNTRTHIWKYRLQQYGDTEQQTTKGTTRLHSDTATNSHTDNSTNSDFFARQATLNFRSLLGGWCPPVIVYISVSVGGSVSVSHISCFIDLPNSIHDYHRRTRQESWGAHIFLLFKTFRLW